MNAKSRLAATLRASKITSRIVLIGGGHSHVQFLKNWRLDPIPGVEIILISKDVRSPYSGMLPARLAGWYTDSEMHFDLLNLCAQSGVTFLCDEVVQIDRERKHVYLLERPPLAFDFASINVGVTPKWPSVRVDRNAQVLAVKPIAELLSKWDRLAEQTTAKGSRWVIVGGGAAGFELGIICTLLFKRQHIQGEVHLVHSGKALLSGHSATVQARARNLLEACGVTIHFNREVQEIQAQQLICRSGLPIAFDKVILTTGAMAPRWLRDSGLPVDADGFVQVDGHLRVNGGETVFAAGDCIHFSERPLPKSGVYAVREGPVLVENLRRSVLGMKSLRRYRPQRRVMALLTSGDRRAMISFGPLAFESAWLWKWKDRIDRKFMEMFGAAQAEPMAVNSNTCGGCGGKLPAQDLRVLIDELRKDKKFQLPSQIEDVGVVEGVMASIDGFRTFTPDLFLFGQVATWHALNDVYASGATPLGVNVYAGVPEASTAIRRNQLQHLMSGVLTTLSHAGAPLMNAHTAESAETTLVVAPVAKGEVRWKKSGLQPGDILILTKALGTGALLQAMMNGALPAEVWPDLKRSLLHHHAGLLDDLNSFDLRGCTDISGFGLGGHLAEMVEASQVSVELNILALPLIAGFLDSNARGFRSFLSAQNRLAFAPMFEGDPENLKHPALWDPQTHGPLLFGVAEANAAAVLSTLARTGYNQAVPVAVVRAGAPDCRIRFRGEDVAKAYRDNSFDGEGKKDPYAP